MDVAGVAETVTVQAETPLIQTTRSELADSIQEVQIESLPVLGRDWLGFAVLAYLASANFSDPSRSANQPYLPRQLQLGIMFRW